MTDLTYGIIIDANANHSQVGNRRIFLKYSVEGVFAEGEPSAQQLAELVEYCRSNNVTTVFAEEIASPEVSNTLASEVGSKVETICTVESAEDGKTYLERMEDNLSKIYDTLS